MIFYILTLIAVFAVTTDYRFLANVQGLPSITLVELVTLATIYFFCGYYVIHRGDVAQKAHKVYRENKVIFWYFIWAAFAAMVGLLKSTDTLRFYKDLVPSVIIYFLVVSYINNNTRLKTVITVYLVGATINLFLGLSQILFNTPRIVALSKSAMSKMDLSGEFLTENIPTGLFTHPNGYALFLMPVLILLVSLILSRCQMGVSVRLLLFSLLLLLAFNLQKTYAKGVYAWSLIGIVLFFIPDFLKRWRMNIGIFVLLAGCFGITWVSLNLLSMNNRAFGTMLTRYQLWQAAMATIQSDWFILMFGNGFDEMFLMSARYSNFRYPNAHNTFINQILFFGFPALVLYLWATLKVLNQLSHLLRSSKNFLKTIGLFLFSTLIALSGAFFFEPGLGGVVLQAQFFFLLALATAASRKDLQEDQQGL